MTFAQADDCQSGTDTAKADFSNGILRTYLFGLTHSFTFGKILKDDYGIDVIYWGCIVDEKWDCYSKYMDERIKEKYGKDIFEKVAKKSWQLDSLGMGDRQSTFPGGERELMKFVYCTLDLEKAKYSDDKKGRVNLQFSIDTDGKVTDIKVVKGLNADYNSEAIRIMSLMPKWTSETQNGKAVKKTWYLPIVFDNDWRQKHCP